MSTAVALPRPGAATSRLRFVGKELVLWLGLHPVYLAIRGLSIDSYATALANAHDLISVERSLSLFREASVQDALSAFHGVGLAAGHDTGSFGGVVPFNPNNHYFPDSAAGVAVVLSALVAIRLFNRKER